MAETTDDVEPVPECFERLENRLEFKAGASGGRRVLAHDRAVRHIDKAEARRNVRRSLCLRGQRRNHCVEQGQRQRGAGTLEQVSAVKVFSGNEHKPSGKNTINDPGLRPARLALLSRQTHFSGICSLHSKRHTVHDFLHQC